MRPKMFRNLDEIYAGLCDGMTYEDASELVVHCEFLPTCFSLLSEKPIEKHNGCLLSQALKVFSESRSRCFRVWDDDCCGCLIVGGEGRVAAAVLQEIEREYPEEATARKGDKSLAGAISQLTSQLGTLTQGRVCRMRA